MARASRQIQSAAGAISQNIEALASQRALLSQNILAQIWNLVEGVIVPIHAGIALFCHVFICRDGDMVMKTKAANDYLGIKTQVVFLPIYAARRLGNAGAF